MGKFIDDLARQVAQPMPRRQLLGVIASAMVGAVASKLGVRAQTGECDPENDPLYPHPCGDICCRFDYKCSSATLVNGGGTKGICCPADATLCSNGIGGWCCPRSVDSPQTACGTQPFECVCPSGAESCGDSGCCPEDSFCCNPEEGLCCKKEGGICCLDQFERGTCCEEGTECVPVSATGTPPGHTCCPDKQACIGQCCADEETCVLGNQQEGFLYCCPDSRATPARDACCDPGYVAMPDGTCCFQSAFCNGTCCTGGTACIDGECKECPEGQESCSGSCCAPGTCCFGTCCAGNSCCFGKCCSGADVVCTGECTKLEVISGPLSPSQPLSLMSTDGETVQSQATVPAASPPSFNSYLPANTVSEPVTVTYTSQAAPTHPLPAEYRLLRTFQLTAQRENQTSVSKLLEEYYMFLTYTPVTLAAMEVASEESLALLFWNGESWINLLPCDGCAVRASAAQMTILTDVLGEFALVAKVTAITTGPLYLPYVQR